MKIDPHLDADELSQLNPAIPSLQMGSYIQTKASKTKLLKESQPMEQRNKMKGFTKAQIFKIVRFKQNQERKIKKKQRELKKKKNSRWFFKYGTNKHLRFFFISLSVALIVYYAIFIYTMLGANYTISIEFDQKSIKCLDIEIETPMIGSEIDCFGLQKDKKYQKWKDNIEKQHLRKGSSFKKLTGNKYLKKDRQKSFNFTLPLNLENKYFSNYSSSSLATFQLGLQQRSFSHLKDSSQDLTLRMNNFNQYQEIKNNNFCIVTYLSHQFEYIDYAEYFTSLKSQKIQNMKIILIFQSETLHQLDKILYLIQTGFPQLQHQITFIQNHQTFGKIGSQFINSKKCGVSDIVVYVGIQHLLIKSWSLARIGLTFANPQVWLTYSNYLVFGKKPKLINTGQINSSSLIRTQLQNKTVPNLFAHRRGLANSIPLQLLTQYFKVKNKENQYNPRFAVDQRNSLLFYAMVQQCGSSHAKYIDDYLFIEKQIQKKQECYKQLEKMNKYKSLMKRPLKVKNKVDDTSTVDQSSQLSVQLIQQLKICFKMYIQCKDQFRKGKRNQL